MWTRGARAAVVCVALLVAAHAQCVAACSVEPCGTALKLKKLPPCHRKHLPTQADRCVDTVVADHIEARHSASPVIFVSAPLRWVPAAPVAAAPLLRSVVFEPSPPPHSRSLQLHSAFRI